MAQKEIGRVIANYDIDNRRSGFGRGIDDQFMPDIERLDGEKLKDRRPANLAPLYNKSTWIFAGLFAIGLTAFVGRRMKLF